MDRPQRGRVAVLFDLDGTLTDSAVGVTAAIERALLEFDITVDDPMLLVDLIGPPLEDTLGPRFGLSATQIAHAIAVYREYYTARGRHQNRVYGGICDLLGGLRDRGTRLAVATAKPTGTAAAILDSFGLSSYFSAVSGASLDGSRRDKSAIIAVALELLGVEPGGFVMVGDRSHDVAGAHAHGGVAIGVAWGYGTPEELRSAGADEIVHDVGALALTLERRLDAGTATEVRRPEVRTYPEVVDSVTVDATSAPGGSPCS